MKKKIRKIKTIYSLSFIYFPHLKLKLHATKLLKQKNNSKKNYKVAFLSKILQINGILYIKQKLLSKKLYQLNILYKNFQNVHS